LRGTPARHCKCGARLAADQRGPLCSACQRRPAAGVIGPPSVPADFWLTGPMPAALATRHLGTIIRAYRSHPWHGRPVSQATVATWASTDQAQVSRIESGPPVHDLRRLAHWSRTLRIPPRLLWFEPPSSTDHVTDAEEVSPTRRRDVIAFSGLALASPAIDGLERELDLIHLTLDRGTTSEERTTRLERTASDLGVQAVEEAPDVINPALRAMRTVRGLLEERQPTRQQVRLVRVTAMLSTVVGEILFQTGNFSKAREWYQTAGHAAADIGDRNLMDIALAGQAYLPTYSNDPRGALALLAPRLEANPIPSPAVAWLWGFTARAHAALGDLTAFQRSIQNAHEALARSPAELVGPGIFSRQPANLLFYEATGAVALSQSGPALSAADRAAAHLTHGDTDRILVRLEMARALAQSGEVPEACRVATDALMQPGFYHDVGVRAYATKFDVMIRGIQSPETREWRQVLAASHGASKQA
jgi:tetratricopeptide (TPR) repeat protein